jgi:hypothetical protein
VGFSVQSPLRPPVPPPRHRLGHRRLPAPSSAAPGMGASEGGESVLESIAMNSRCLWRLLVCALCLALGLGMTNVGLSLAGAVGADDDCCESEGQAPCSGATDDCFCPCCPFPVLSETAYPLLSSSRTMPVFLALSPAPPSADGPSLDHPPD